MVLLHWRTKPEEVETEQDLRQRDILTWKNYPIKSEQYGKKGTIWKLVWEHGNMGTGGVESREMAGTRGAGRKHEGLPNGLSCDWHLNGH
jgi:hypothetical protein